MITAILKFNDKEFIYHLTRRAGMKTIRLKVKADGSIHVSADPSVSLCAIERFMQEKADWIERHQAAGKQPQPLEFANGTVIQIYGKRYTICVTNTNAANLWRIANNQMIVSTEQSECHSVIEQCIMQFISEQSRIILPALLAKYLESSLYQGVKPNLKIKYLKSKWGHCMPQRPEICLNFALCSLPFSLCECVVAHEVAHLFVPNHSKAFYLFGETLMPGFAEHNKQLRHYSPDIWQTIICDSQETPL